MAVVFGRRIDGAPMWVLFTRKLRKQSVLGLAYTCTAPRILLDLVYDGFWFDWPVD